MTILHDLQEASSDTEHLESFIKDYFQDIYDFFRHQKHSNLTSFRREINQYIALNRQVLLSLNLTKLNTAAFLELLMDISERLSLIASFRFLYEHLDKKAQYDIGSRLKAASLYLINVRSIEDHIVRCDQIVSLLQDSFANEEDSDKLVVATMLSFYSLVIDDFAQFNPDAVLIIRKKIEANLAESEHSFLNHPIILEALGVDVHDHSVASGVIRQRLDEYLGRDSVLVDYRQGFLIEKGTEYERVISKIPINFNSLRDICVQRYNDIRDDQIFHSLQRGVSILENENQLYAYMYSYGNMHHKKLMGAFASLPDAAFEDEICIVDWGCGQGMATISFFDFLALNKHQSFVKRITLIEPSQIALKRASLHATSLGVKKISTINKDFDGLLEKDFRDAHEPTVHFFSNVLDIDHFSMSRLINLIKETFNGTNYFVCVSPYINGLKISRLDSFMNSFSKHEGFKVFATLQHSSGEWQGSWTRVYRIFQAKI